MTPSLYGAYHLCTDVLDLELLLVLLDRNAELALLMCNDNRGNGWRLATTGFSLVSSRGSSMPPRSSELIRLNLAFILAPIKVGMT